MVFRHPNTKEKRYTHVKIPTWNPKTSSLKSSKAKACTTHRYRSSYRHLTLCAARVISFALIPTSGGGRLVEQRSCIPCAPMQRFMDIPENREQYWPCQPLLWWWFSPLLLCIFSVLCTFLCSAFKCLCVFFDWVIQFWIVRQASLWYMFS